MREALEKRPALLLCAGLIVGLTAVSHPINLVFLPLALYLARRLPGMALVIGAFGIGLLLTPTPATTILGRERVRGTGTVVSVPRLYAARDPENPGRGAAMRPDMTACDFEMEHRIYRLQVPGWPAIALGDRLMVSGEARPIREGEEYLLLAGVSARLRVEAHGWRIENPAPAPLRFADAWRRDFVAFCGRSLEPRVAAAVDAMCFNVDTLLDEEVREDLERTGTVHIVSASGLHAFVFAMAIQGLLSLLPVPRGVQLALLGLVLALYACAAGLQPPIVRAVLIAMAGACAYVVRREPDLLSALGLAAVLYLLLKPLSVYNLGFQLSFITVGAFALFLPRREHGEQTRLLGRLGRDLLSVVRGTVVATLATMPLLAHAFGYASVVAVVSNVLVVLAVSVVIVVAMGAHVVAFLLPPLAQGAMSVVVAPLVGWLHFVLERTGSPEWAVVRVPHFNVYWLPVIYGALLLTWRRRIVQP